MMLNVHRKSYKWLDWLALCLGLFVLTTTLYGIVLSYSPVPITDEWWSYIDVYREIIQNSTYHYLWTQHNEHRIVISKLFFWLDFKLFNGNNIFGLAINFITQLSTCYCMYFIAKKNLNNRVSTFIIASLALSLAFSWQQYENFTHIFQSQFFFVFLFAILALWFFSKVSLDDNKTNYKALLLSALFYVLSSLSFSAGLMVGIGLIAQAIFFHRSKKVFLYSIAMVLLISAIWSIGYQTPSNQALLTPHYLVQVIKYLFFLVGYTHPIIGLLLCTCITYLAIKIYRQNTISQPLAALLSILIFLLATLLLIAYGRAYMNIGMQSRYITPVNLVWFFSIIFIFSQLRLTYLLQKIIALLLILTIIKSHIIGFLIIIIGFLIIIIFLIKIISMQLEM